MGEDEFELIPRQELERLRQVDQQNASQPPVAISQLQGSSSADTNATPIDRELITSLNVSLERLNISLSRLLILFDKAQKDAAGKLGTSDDGYAKLESQNEKIASGIIALANMIRDQQIQINQLNLLFKGIQDKMEELRLQRRPTVPAAAFKISPSLIEEEKHAYPTPLSETHQIEIEIPRGPSREILEEEKQEDYQTLSMFSQPSAQQDNPQRIPQPPPPGPEIAIEHAQTNLPPPPAPDRRGILKFLKK